MAVSDEDRRRFATEAFVEKALSRDINAIRAHLASATKLPNLMRQRRLSNAEFLYAQYVESRAWIYIGAHIGYFDKVPLLPAEGQIMQLASGPVILERVNWPSWFRRFATGLNEPTPGSEILADLEFEDASSRAIFQAALILAEGFRDPSCITLQKNLQFSESVLDGFLPPSTDDVLEALRVSESAPTSTAGQCMAGLFRLLQLLPAFESLFPTPAGDSPTGKNLSPRSALARVIANVLQWRLNLWDERAVRRLGALTAAFFRLCEQEFRNAPAEFGISWSEARSRDLLSEMLDRWRDRADQEPTFEIDSNIFGPEGGSLTGPAEPEGVEAQRGELEELSE